MKKNMGSVDRIIRLVIAAVLAYIYFGGIQTGAVGVVLLVISGIMLVTSLINFCPLYTLLGINTCGINARKSQ
jgi:hypothetical protein